MCDVHCKNCDKVVASGAKKCKQLHDWSEMYGIVNEELLYAEPEDGFGFNPMCACDLVYLKCPKCSERVGYSIVNICNACLSRKSSSWLACGTTSSCPTCPS
jgi:hypothetical protein